MEDKLYCVSLNEFIRVTTGWLYSLAPGHKPRFINEIVDEMIVRFKRDAQHIGDDFFYHEVNWFGLRVLVENVLMPIKQFRDLNLSKREYGLGIDVDDPNRTEFVFVSRGSSIPEENNFIDLDACIRNIVSSLEHICGADMNGLGNTEDKELSKKDKLELALFLIIGFGIMIITVLCGGR